MLVYYFTSIDQTYRRKHHANSIFVYPAFINYPIFLLRFRKFSPETLATSKSLSPRPCWCCHQQEFKILLLCFQCKMNKVKVLAVAGVVTCNNRHLFNSLATTPICRRLSPKKLER